MSAAIAIIEEVRGDSRLNRLDLGSMLANVAGYLVYVGELDRAEATLRELIARRFAMPLMQHNVTNALEHLALVFVLGHKAELGAKLAGYCDAALRRVSYQRDVSEASARERLGTLLRDRFPPHILDELTEEGEAYTEERAVREALGESSMASAVSAT